MRISPGDTVGLTVVEVIVALAVITVGLLPLITAMPRGLGAIGESSRKTTAAFLAQQRLEQIRNARWSFAPPADCLGVSAADTAPPVAATWANCPGSAPLGLVTYPDEGFGTMTGYPHFQRQVRVRNCDAASCGVVTSALRRVAVTVSFARVTGVGTLDAAPEHLKLVTLVARRP